MERERERDKQTGISTDRQTDRVLKSDSVDLMFNQRSIWESTLTSWTSTASANATVAYKNNKIVQVAALLYQKTVSHQLFSASEQTILWSLIDWFNLLQSLLRRSAQFLSRNSRRCVVNDGPLTTHPHTHTHTPAFRTQIQIRVIVVFNEWELLTQNKFLA